MRYLYSAFSLVLALLAAGTLSAQTGTLKFPEDTGGFVEPFGEFMTASKRPDLEEAFTLFKKKVKSGDITADELKRVASVANQLADLNLTPFPYFKNYVNAVVGAKNQSDKGYFDQWHTVLEHVVALAERGKVKPVGLFLEFSASFNENRTIKSGEGGAATWMLRGGRTLFEPAGNVAVLRCSNVDLIGTRKQDSTIIVNTSGIYLPSEGIWRGSDGKVAWADAGLESGVYAQMTTYKIDVVRPLYQCDTAYLYYPLYFGNTPVAGKFEDNIIAETRSNKPYPKFESFDKNIAINKLGDGIEYTGGFRLSGASLYGYGSRTEPARLTIYNKKRERVFFGMGELFVIKREQTITAEGVNANMFMEGDTLFHPAIGFRVDIPQQIINLTRGDKGSERNPFYSSFYNMNLDAEKITWNVARDSVEIGSRIGVQKGITQKVSFESSQHFDAGDYNRMQQIASQNPISTLYVLWKEKKQERISDNEFAQRINPKFDYSSIQTLLAQLVAEGFINYFFDQHEIEVRPKLAHYALASQGKKDYDAINIVSESDQANARLNLKTKETTVNEVRKLELSDRQKVAVMPDKSQLTLLKNRDMRFGGKLFAGFGLFQGRSMYFNYEKFQVEFDSVRQLDLYLPTGEKDKNGQPVANAMNSSIEYLSGVLLVDAPNNKSGKNDLAIFPSLQSKEPSYVFYDRKDIQGGVYKRDSFYFKLDPFAFNGLDSYTPDQLKFRGEMAASTIFAPFKETIVVRDHDKSFGFVHQTPPAGYPTYSKRGNYTGALDLSNKGFMGKGKVEYLNASIESEDIIFRPRQMLATAKRFDLEEDRKSAVKTPQARGQDVRVNWLPYRDSMYIESKAKAFEIFKAPGYSHKGLFVLTPSGLKGRGDFEWAQGKLSSKLISYGPFQASADTAALQIKAGNAIALESPNIDGELDFDAQIGQFKANSASLPTTLPLNKFKTSMNEFTWDMKAQKVAFKADPNVPGRFVSIDPEQDSLAFAGKTALYDMQTNLLKIGGVDIIKSADAYIYPDSGAIVVKPGGQLAQLTNARIVADTVSKYHTITRATVDILGKKSFRATGYYQYDIPGYKQEVYFNNIFGERVGAGLPSQKNVLTTAGGEIAEKDSFHMDAKTLFRGTIILKSNKPNLRFEGFAQLLAQKLPNNPWFSVYTEVDKNDPTLRIKNSKNPEGDPLVTGFYISRESGELYPRVLLPAYLRADREIMDCQGVVRYDAKTNRFTFGDSLRVLNKSLRGGQMIVDDRTGVVDAQGPLSLGAGLKYMKINGAGRLKSDFTKADSTFYKVTGEFMTGIELNLPAKLLDVLNADLRAATLMDPAGMYTTQLPFYQPALAEFIKDDKDLQEALTTLQGNLVQLPKKTDKNTFLLGRHGVIWNEDYQSFVSTEDKMPVISINGEPFNKNINVFVEYKMPSSGDDRFYLYLKAADQWYFFGYQSGVLNLASNNQRFNDVLLGLKPKELQLKMPDGEVYEIASVSPATADAFVNRVKQGRTRGQ